MTWTEQFDLTNFLKRAEEMETEIKELKEEVASLKEAITSMNILNTMPAGAYVPRNHRRFGV